MATFQHDESTSDSGKLTMDFLAKQVQSLQKVVIRQNQLNDHLEKRVRELEILTNAKLEPCTPKYNQEQQSSDDDKFPLDKSTPTLVPQSPPTERRGIYSKTEGTPARCVRRGIRASSGIAFSVYLDYFLHWADVDHVIKYNKVLLNDGDAYNINTGIFTAPVTGVYVFHYHLTGSGQLNVRLVVDGVLQNDMAVVTSEVQEMGGNTAIIRINAGQTIWLESYLGVGTFRSTPDYRLNTWSGYLLYE